MKIDGHDIHHSGDLFRALDAHNVGDEVDVTVVKQGQTRTVKVKLQALQ